ncbi:MAG TPA: immunoglobulin domain-containing protein [Opitutaceae bacterium]
MRRTLAAALLLLALRVHAQAPAYTATLIPTLGGTQSEAFGVNSSGAVASQATTAGDLLTQASVYLNGATLSLGTLGGSNSYGAAINDSQQLTGNSQNSTDTAFHAYLDTKGIMKDLGTLGGTNSYGLAINASGTIAGTSEVTGDASTHAFVDQSGTMTDLGTFGGSNSNAYGINAAGMVVGNAELAVGSANHHAFAYVGGTMSDLGTLGGVLSTALAVNDLGVIVGDSQTAAGDIHAFAYEGGVMSDLGTIGGASGTSNAKAVNVSGVIVGFSAVSGGGDHAFIYTGGTMQDLNSLASIPGVTLTSAVGINSLGQIAANGSDNQGYLLTPTGIHLVVTAPSVVNHATPLTVTVTAIDASGDVAVAYGGSILLTSSDPSAKLPAALLLTNGTATLPVTLETVGNQTVTAADTAIPGVKGTSAPIDVIVAVAPQITAQPQSQTVNLGANAAFWVSVSGTQPLSYQWYMNGAPIAGATNALLTDVDVNSLGAGSVSVTVSNLGGSVSSAAAGLFLGTSSGNPAAFTSQPFSQTVEPATRFSLEALAGTLVPAPSYQWFQNGSPVPGGNGPTLLLYASPQTEGTYVCIATTKAGSIISGPATVTVDSAAQEGPMLDMSCRTSAGSGEDELVVGFVVAPAGQAGTEPVLVRASGPALAQFGVSGVLPDPSLTLDGPSGVIASNGGWAGNSTVAAVAAEVGAFAWTSASSHDSALVENLPAGAYTAQVTGASGDSGVVLAEMYDAGAEPTPGPLHLSNISARAQVSPNDVLIAGFVIGGTAARTVLIRASGPALGQFALGGLLADPELRLYRSNADGTSALLDSEAGWQADASIAAAAAAAGAFSWGSIPTADSAFLISLPPGAYTAEVTGASGDGGLALIEVYEVQ